MRVISLVQEVPGNTVLGKGRTSRWPPLRTYAAQAQEGHTLRRLRQRGFPGRNICWTTGICQRSGQSALASTGGMRTKLHMRGAFG